MDAIDWSALFESPHLLPAIGVAAATAFGLSLVFGLTRRTVVAAVFVAMAVRYGYPGGTAGLVDDLLRPLSHLSEETAARNAAEHEAVATATGEPSR